MLARPTEAVRPLRSRWCALISGTALAAFGVRVMIAGLMLTAAPSGAAQTATTFLAVNGGASIEVAGTASPARMGATIPDGATVSTDSGRTARIQLIDGSTLEIEQKSRVTFDPATQGDVALHLVAGTIRLDAPAKPRANRVPVAIVTAQSHVTFRRTKGYVTSSSDQDVVTCLKCNVLDSDQCERNDFTIRDASTCVSLRSALVAIVTRQHGIQPQTVSAEAMLHSIIEQLGGAVAVASEGVPWWKAATAVPGAPVVDRHAVALNGVGQKAELSAQGAAGAGDIWWMSMDPRVAVVDDVDPAGTCKMHAAGPGRTAIVAFDQLGRYVPVAIDVKETAAD